MCVRRLWLVAALCLSGGFARADMDFAYGTSACAVFDTRGTDINALSGATVHRGGTLSASETWAAGSVHVVYGTITVPTNATLTIASGAVVKFVGGGIVANGAVVANGVTFTDIDDDSFGGDTRRNGTERTYPSYVLTGKVETDEETLVTCARNNDAFYVWGEIKPMAFDTRGTDLNALSGATVHRGGTLSASETWAAGSVHVVYGTITVPTNATLTIASGAVVKFVGGGIVANGTVVANGVTFTDIDDDSFGGDTRQNGTERTYPSYVLTGKVETDEETLVTCARNNDAFYVWGETAVMAFNTRGVVDAETLAEATVHIGCVLDADEVWSSNEVHVVYGTLVVPAGVTLWIEPGAIVKFLGGGIWSDGCVVAKGVTFADANSDAFGGDTLGNGNASSAASYDLIGNVETDDATLATGQKNRDRYFTVGDAPTMRLALSDSRFRFAHDEEPIAYSTAWDAGSRVEVSVTDPSGATQVLTNGTSDCSGVLTWRKPEAVGKYTFRHQTDVGTLEADLYVATGIELHEGLLSGTNVWAADVVHVLNGAVTVPSGASLTIEPGAVVKVMPGSSFTVEAGGCTAAGVVFTHIYDDTLGGDTFADGSATVPEEGDYTVLGYIRDDASTEYRYATRSLTGTLAGNETWQANRTYVIDGTLTVASGATLTIPEGTVVKFASGSSLVVADGGVCLAAGAIFTHLADDEVGGDTNGDGEESAPVVGAYSIKGNVIDDAATEYRYSLEVLQASVTADTTLRGHRVYVVSNDVTVSKGATLTIRAGAILKFASGKSLIVNSGGALDAQGMRSAPIVFTSIRDDDWGGDTNGDENMTEANPGDWHQIRNNGTIVMNYCDVFWCSAQNDQGALYPNGGTWLFKNSIAAHCLYDNMRSGGGTFTAENSMFLDGSMGASPASGSSKFVNCVFNDLTTAVRWGCGEFYNCVFSDIATDIIDTKFHSSTLMCKFDHCVFWNPEGTGDHAAEKVGQNGCVYADPLFTDPDFWDFTILDDSPCADAGNGEVAPSTDYYGRPRQTLMTVVPTGTRSANGKYPDIGICEVLPRLVATDVDLEVMSVVVPETLAVGETATVSWTVRNVGSEYATGQWVDAVEIVSANGSTVTLGTKDVNGNLAPGGMQSFTGTWTVPSAQTGAVRIRVTTNANRDLYEGTLMANNVKEAAVAGELRLPELALAEGEPTAVSVAAGETAAYRLGAAFAEGGLLIVRSSGAVSLRTGAGQVPSADIFYANAVKVSDGVYLVRAPATDDGYVAFENASTAAVDLEVEPVVGAFELFETGLVTVPNSGTASVTLYGNGFTDDIEAYLEGNGRSVRASDTAVAESVKLTAVFDVDGLPAGTYRVRLVQDGEEASGEALAVTNVKAGPKWTCKLEMSSSVRAGRTYTGHLVYANEGDVALDAPYVVLTSTGGTTIRFDKADAWAQTLELMATSETYPASRLKPGETVRVPFYYTTSGSGVSVSFTYTESDAGAFPWDTNGAYMRPSWATDEMWNRALATLKRHVGLTWDAYLARMRANCDHLQKIGSSTRRVDRLWQLEVSEALGVDHAVSTLASGTDLVRSGRGMGLSFARTYGAGMHQRLRKGVLGYGWSDNLSVFCELQESGSRFVIQSGNGSSYGFTKATGAWKSEDARDKTAMTETGTHWILTTRGGTVIRFAKANCRLADVRDNMGNGLTFAHDAEGRVTSVTHTDGQRLAFTYADGLLVTASDDQGRTVRYAYANGMLAEVTAFNGRKVRYDYCASDETAASRALRQIVAADGQTKDFTYDDAGRVATVARNGTHFLTEIVRGELGSYAEIAPNGGVTEVTVGASGETLKTVNALGQAVQRVYTSDTLLEAVVAPSGKRSKIVYDADGQAVKSLDAAGAATSFAYDSDFGALKSVTDARQHAITYGYDALGRSESVSFPDEAHSRLRYSDKGDVTNAVNARGEAIAYDYDAEGNKVRAVWPDGRTFAWTYDAKGNCTAASDSVTGTVTMEYDDKEQLTRIAYPKNRGFTYTYDEYARIVSRTSFDGHAQKYAYDAFGRLAQMTDGEGRLYVSNAYDAVTGHLVLQTYGNGTVVSNAYDLLGRTIGIYHYAVGDDLRASRLTAFFEYAYNEDGQRIAQTTAEGVERYTYDAAGQLVGVAYPDGTSESFVYDAVGNRTSANGATYAVNDLNQYTAISTSTSTSTSLSYDLDGNLISRTDADGATTTYAYDCENRLIAVTNEAQGIRWSCAYDVFGNRVAVTENGVTTEKLYVQGALPSVAAEYRDGTLAARHILAGSVRIADVVGDAASAPLDQNSVRYYHADGLASTRLLTDATGAVVATASYKAFGDVRVATGNATNGYGHASRVTAAWVGTLGVERDATGLLFMRNRYYDPAMGRFVQRDPIGMNAGDVNWYRYCGNDGIVNFDVFGCALTQCQNVHDPDEAAALRSFNGAMNAIGFAAGVGGLFVSAGVATGVLVASSPVVVVVGGTVAITGLLAATGAGISNGLYESRYGDGYSFREAGLDIAGVALSTASGFPTKTVAGGMVNIYTGVASQGMSLWGFGTNAARK